MSQISIALAGFFIIALILLFYKNAAKQKQPQSLPAYSLLFCSLFNLYRQ